MILEIKKINSINTTDMLYDIKLKQFVIYPNDVDINMFDINYIRKNCFGITIK